MRRRDFIKVVAGSASFWPLAAHAQQGERMRLIGVLMGWPESDRRARSYLAAFRGALAKLGWMEGSNIRIELRWSAADPDRMKTFAKELVNLRPDAIFSQTTPAISALARETRTIPIVFVLVSDPIGSGFAASLAYPRGNITGFMGNDPAIGGKWMELLKEIAPRTARVALLSNPAKSHEATGIHRICRRYRRGVAVRGPRTATGDAGDRISPELDACRLDKPHGRLPPGPEGSRICVEGQNVATEYRFAENDRDKLTALVKILFIARSQ